MVLKFSQRYAYTPPSQIQRESIDRPLRNALWSILFRYFFGGEFILLGMDLRFSPQSRLAEHLWVDFFEERVNTFSADTFPKFFEKHFFESEWYVPYECIESILDQFNTANLNSMSFQCGSPDDFIREINLALEKHISAYRLVGGRISPITSSCEIDGIEQALSDTSALSTVNAHLANALGKWSDRQAPDYRNSIKESICAVETLCKTIVGKTEGTLGDSLKGLKSALNNRDVEIHPCIVSAWDKHYGYTCIKDGVRHGYKEASQVSQITTSAEAKYMLVSCSAFVSYLIQLANDAGIDLNKASKPCPEKLSPRD
jgi:hypothetical protein